jgi:hypothetical protein
MKIKLLTALLVVIIFSSCIKIGGTPTYPFTGVYSGYRIINRLGNQGLPFNMALYPDGSLAAEEREPIGSSIALYYGTGTWTTFSKNLSFSYVMRDSMENVLDSAFGTAVFNDTTGALNNAVWRDYYSSSQLDSGTFFLLNREN